MTSLYLIALGSNMRHPRFGPPRAVLDAAVLALEDAQLAVLALSPVIASHPLGPSQREYANAAAVVETKRDPVQMLEQLQQIEAQFGRRRHGQRWRARVLDLDIILWSGGVWQSAELTIPHLQMASRSFVLGPASSVAGHWRDPVSGHTIRQLHRRNMRRE